MRRADDDPDPPSFDPEHTPPRTQRAAWFLVIGLGILVFELTANPALTILVGCLKFGWDEFRAARQTRLHDPNPVRGRALSRFQIAHAFWKISLLATALMFVVATIGSALQVRQGPQRPNGPPIEFITSILIAFVGFLLSGLASFVAVVSALRGQVKIWVGRRENRVKPILLSVILIGITPILLLLFLPIFGLVLKLNVPGGVMSFVLVLMFGYPVAVLILLDWLERRIAARTPAECWPELFDPWSFPPFPDRRSR